MRSLQRNNLGEEKHFRSRLYFFCTSIGGAVNVISFSCLFPHWDLTHSEV